MTRAVVGGHREARSDLGPWWSVAEDARSDFCLCTLVGPFSTFVGGASVAPTLFLIMRREHDAGVGLPFHVGSCVAVAVRALGGCGRSRGLSMQSEPRTV